MEEKYIKEITHLMDLQKAEDIELENARNTIEIQNKAINFMNDKIMKALDKLKHIEERSIEEVIKDLEKKGGLR